jgi:aldehyde:ferredoxin oxidoreductase
MAFTSSGVQLGGYHRRARAVDLSSGSVRDDELPVDVLRRLIGGVGLGTWLLMRHGAPGLDPFAPAAPLVVSLSPLVGTPLTTSAKFAVVAKSPLTERICDALASDRFAIELKACGLDALVLTGACEDWSVLVVDGEDIRLEDASDLRGLSSLDAEARIRERLGPRFRFFGIGVAGENLVRFATASGDGRHAGRGGLGAVFGSKCLKGIVVRGTRLTPLADRDRVLALAKDLSSRSLGPETAKYRELGTVANLLAMNRLAALPTRNFTSGRFEHAEAVSGEALQADRTVRKHCAACTIGCEHVFKSKSGKSVRMEYEGLFALGPLCGIADRDVILEAAALCDELGIDVISAGGTCAFAMELAGRDLLPGAPRFGDGPGLLRLLEQIGRRDGLGELLAEGSRSAAAQIGGEAPRFAIHVKGLELPGYEPRALQTMALGLAVSTRGADHNRSGAYEEDFRAGGDRFSADESKGPAALASEVKAAVMDSLILCKFLRGIFRDFYAESAELLSAVTGFDMDGAELEESGRRIVTLRKLLNEREGWTAAEDTLPDRFLDEPLEGPSGERITLGRDGLDRMIASYYRAHGWTDRGTVPPARLAALRMTDLVSGTSPETGSS